MKNYLVGYGRVDITPMESVPLAGFGNTSMRMSRCVRDPLYASCFAITDEKENTVILITMDLQRGGDRETAVIREYCLRAFGIPKQQVMVSGTHTHAAPDQFNEKEPSIQRYLKTLDMKLQACVTMAMADRKEATMYMGDVEADRLNFVRHYCHTTAEGETKYFGDAFGTPVLDGTTRHATEADPTIHIVKFVRQGCKDLVLVNFRAHGTLCAASHKKFAVSADLVGGIRMAFEEKTDGLLSYFQGAAGNIAPRSRILDEMITDDCMAYGKLFADHVIEGLKHLHPVQPEPMKLCQTMLTVPVNKPDEKELEVCLAAQKVWKATNDVQKALEAGASIGLRSPQQANAVVARSNLEDTETVEMNAISLGELAIITSPNELFDTISVYVEDHAPFKKVLTFCYCNDAMGYIPSQLGFDYTCYESDCCRFRPGIGEIMQDKYLQMLQQLKED